MSKIILTDRDMDVFLKEIENPSPNKKLKEAAKRFNERYKNMEKEELYYIQDTREIVGNCVLWWKPESKGYTTQIDEAGVYTKEEADRIAKGRGTDKPWPKSIVDKCIVKHVRMDMLYYVRND